ncbi:MAG: cbb3-type cytochrome c oxidase subunit II [Verrucomicrobiota bacterium]
MNDKQRYISVWIGFLTTFATAWFGLVILPIFNLGQFTDEVQHAKIPKEKATLIDLGRDSYVSNGCIYCHSQQVRPSYAGSDMKYFWGDRRTMPTDYINDKVALLGTMRTGPDLSNIGVRQPSIDWHLTHLYNPQITSQGSVMPPYDFLFRKQKIVGVSSPNALKLSGEYSPPEGYEVVPKREALALVQYLLSLQKSKNPLPDPQSNGPS